MDLLDHRLANDPGRALADEIGGRFQVAEALRLRNGSLLGGLVLVLVPTLSLPLLAGGLGLFANLLDDFVGFGRAFLPLDRKSVV